ncbi:uncharacterized protein LOC143775093 [Ranitomeya variabilis]|uniref:uncharacterized protein LOC143775093 n=1 Tax=Ranitomeya variabilis TaxID=490064 RepID=UPI004055E6DE
MVCKLSMYLLSVISTFHSVTCKDLIERDPIKIRNSSYDQVMDKSKQRGMYISEDGRCCIRAQKSDEANPDRSKYWLDREVFNKLTAQKRAEVLGGFRRLTVLRRPQDEEQSNIAASMQPAEVQKKKKVKRAPPQHLDSSPDEATVCSDTRRQTAGSSLPNPIKIRNSSYDQVMEKSKQRGMYISEDGRCCIRAQKSDEANPDRSKYWLDREVFNKLTAQKRAEVFGGFRRLTVLRRPQDEEQSNIAASMQPAEVQKKKKVKRAPPQHLDSSPDEATVCSDPHPIKIRNSSYDQVMEKSKQRGMYISEDGRCCIRAQKSDEANPDWSKYWLDREVFNKLTAQKRAEVLGGFRRLTVLRRPQDEEQSNIAASMQPAEVPKKKKVKRAPPQHLDSSPDEATVCSDTRRQTAGSSLPNPIKIRNSSYDQVMEKSKQRGMYISEDGRCCIRAQKSDEANPDRSKYWLDREVFNKLTAQKRAEVCGGFRRLTVLRRPQDEEQSNIAATMQPAAITEIAQKITSIEEQLTSTLSSTEWQNLKTKTDKTVEENHKVLQDEKRVKFQRDSNDYIQDRVYKWKD